MTDLGLALGWAGVLVVGLGGAVRLHRLGLARTYTRDLVHVGAGVWVLGWPWWRGTGAPIAIPVAAALATLLAPLSKSGPVARLRGALAGGDERWTGIVLYTGSFAVFTTLAFADHSFPAGAALLALALGDGIGGIIGRRFGKHFYAAPGGKRKSLEGSVVVAIGAAAGVAVASWALGAPVGPGMIAGAAIVAALAEAMAPRATDNAVVPVAVWAFLRLAVGG